MKLTKGELNQIIVSMKPTLFKYPEDNDVADAVAKKLRIKSSDSENTNEITEMEEFFKTNCFKLKMYRHE